MPGCQPHLFCVEEVLEALERGSGVGDVAGRQCQADGGVGAAVLRVLHQAQLQRALPLRIRRSLLTAFLLDGVLRHICRPQKPNEFCSTEAQSGTTTISVASSMGTIRY